MSDFKKLLVMLSICIYIGAMIFISGYVILAYPYGFSSYFILWYLYVIPSMYFYKLFVNKK